MKRIINAGGHLALGCLLILSAAVVAEEELPTIAVESQALTGFDQGVILPDEQNFLPSDSAELLRSVPGANVNRNGALTGISQYRGMYGSRVNVLIDGLNVAPAGPNWMDPPLSYIPSPLLQDLTVIRGVSPVSAGSETIGGTIKANSRRGEFGIGSDYEIHGNLGLGGQTVDNGYNGDALIWASNDRNLFQVSGAYLKGDDTDAGDDVTITPSQYKRWNTGLGYGFQQGDMELGLAYQYDKTKDTGTPALPMDIIYVKGDSYRGNYSNRYGSVNMDFRMHYIDTDHLMNNYSLRQPPTVMMSGMQMRRFAKTDSKDWGWDLRADMKMGGGELRFGTDGWVPKYNADVFSPDTNAFRVTNYNNVKRNRYGFFGEWEGALSKDWNILAGGRYVRVNSDADEVSATGLGMNQGNADTLAAEFNASDRDRGENLIDLAAVLSRSLNDNTVLQVGLEMKQRAPSYQERYLWLPLESTAGLADGRVYVGDVGLDKETAYNFDIGLDWRDQRSYLTPRVFYKRVDDYIQGTPLDSGTAVAFTRTQVNMLTGGLCMTDPGSPRCTPLQFSNVDAEFYGADAGFGTSFGDNWLLDGTISYVRGKRRDISDNLYRIAPLNGLLGLTYQEANWSVTGQGEFYAAQNKVSETNAEQKSSGYALYHLYGRYEPRRDVTIRAGVRNIFDRFYQNNLSGYNRVSADSDGNPVDLAVGERVPGPGRNFFLQAQLAF
jgi:iron complex outermembrane receptor protein